MNNMFFRTATLLTAYCVTFCFSSTDTLAEVYEVRGYLLGDSGDEEAIDKYLSNALLPCLKRHGIGPIGVFTNAPTDKTKMKTTFVIIPYDDPSAMVQSREVIQSDEEYRNNAAAFFTHGNQEKSYERISSELLIAMQCWPKIKVPPEVLANKNRVYELRTYESAHEILGQRKVEMFNNG